MERYAPRLDPAQSAAPDYQALQTELEIGLLLPCNVIVYETPEGQAVVSIVDPLSMLDVAQNTTLQKVAREAETHLTRVVEKLAGR